MLYNTLYIFVYNVLGMSCPSWQWHRTGYSWLPVWTCSSLVVWPGIFSPNSHGNNAAANLHCSCCELVMIFLPNKSHPYLDHRFLKPYRAALLCRPLTVSPLPKPPHIWFSMYSTSKASALVIDTSSSHMTLQNTLQNSWLQRSSTYCWQFPTCSVLMFP